MQRTKTNKYYILTADWHLREDQPICRIDDHEKTMWKKISFIKELQKKYNATILHAGDLFHNWKPSPNLLSKTIRNIPNQFYTIYGNHDLPQHNMDLYYKSGVYTLQQAGVLNILNWGHWGQEIEVNNDTHLFVRNKKILVHHIMTYIKKLPYPGCIDLSGKKLLKKYKDFDLVITGHNHKPFIIETQDNILINPGSILRQTADQIEHKPRIYLWNSHNNTIKPIYLPIESNIITRHHLENNQKRDDRIYAFISKLDKGGIESIDFSKNIEKFLKMNEVRKSVKNIIYKALES